MLGVFVGVLGPGIRFASGGDRAASHEARSQGRSRHRAEAWAAHHSDAACQRVPFLSRGS